MISGEANFGKSAPPKLLKIIFAVAGHLRRNNVLELSADYICKGSFSNPPFAKNNKMLAALIYSLYSTIKLIIAATKKHIRSNRRGRRERALQPLRSEERRVGKES